MEVGRPCSLPEKFFRMKAKLAKGDTDSASPRIMRRDKMSAELRASAIPAEARDQTRNAAAYMRRIPKRSTSSPAGI